MVKSKKQKSSERIPPKNLPTLKLTNEYDIAYDFATKTYEKFGKIIKSIVLFGSTPKKLNKKGSDIDIIIIIDDCSVQWDQELVAWYREELGKIIQQNPYQKPLHINSVRLSTWWDEMLRGEPVIINIIRSGQAIIDFGGFFNPLKVLLMKGKIKSTPEAIYVTLKRAPMHLMRTKSALINSIDGMYWAMVDSSHAVLIAAKRLPPSPEKISELLEELFVESRMLNSKYIKWYNEMYHLYHSIMHGNKKDVSGKEVDFWRDRTEEYLGVMAKLVNQII